VIIFARLKAKTPAVMFTTEHLILRGFEDNDLIQLLNLRNNARVMRWVTAEPIAPQPTKYKEFLKTLAESSTIWFTILEKKNWHFVGQCSIKVAEPVKNRDGLFGISMLPEFWGKGYGMEATWFTVDHAFKSLGVQRVSLDILEGNEVGIELYKKMWGNSFKSAG
jgi:RimJ/RimL family protein N-acetyltransferase